MPGRGGSRVKVLMVDTSSLVVYIGRSQHYWRFAGRCDSGFTCRKARSRSSYSSSFLNNSRDSKLRSGSRYIRTQQGPLTRGRTADHLFFRARCVPAIRVEPIPGAEAGGTQRLPSADFNVVAQPNSPSLPMILEFDRVYDRSPVLSAETDFILDLPFWQRFAVMVWLRP